MVRNNILLFLKMYCNILICIFISADIFCTEVVQFELHYILVATFGTILKQFDVSPSRQVPQRADWKFKARRLVQPDFEELPLSGDKTKHGLTR